MFSSVFILPTSVFLSLYVHRSKHIKGATFFPFKEVRDTDSKFALMLPSKEKFAEHIGKVDVILMWLGF